MCVWIQTVLQQTSKCDTSQCSAIQRGGFAMATQIHRLESDNDGDEVCPIPIYKVKRGVFGDVGSHAGGEPYEIPEEPALSGLLFGSIFGVGRSKAVHAHLFDYDYSDLGLISLEMKSHIGMHE